MHFCWAFVVHSFLLPGWCCSFRLLRGHSTARGCVSMESLRMHSTCGCTLRRRLEFSTSIRVTAQGRLSAARLQASAAPSSSQAEQLRDWVLAAGPMPVDLTPQAATAGGYGMVCLSPVAEGQELVSIPRKLLMTAETARQAAECGRLVQETGLTEWQTLTLHLLCERAKGKDSFWAPYIAMLPDQSHHPLMWGPEQVSWLDGSPLQSLLTQRQAQVSEDTEALLIAGANDDIRLGEGQPLVSEASVRWAACTLLSRAFSLDLQAPPSEGDDGEERGDAEGRWDAGGTSSSDQDSLALVPWADMLCHSSEAGPESCLRYCPDSDAVQLCAHTSYAPGQQVYDSYGPNLSPGELLMDYGFVDEANENHKVEVDPRDVASPSSSRARALLGALSVVQGESVRMALTPRGPDLAFLTWLRAAVGTDAELIRAGWRVRATAKDVELACRVMGSLSEPLSRENETKVLDALMSFTERQLQRYRSSLEQDQQEVQQLQAQGQRQWLRVAVLRALMSEKLSLQGCREVVAAWQQRLSDGTPVEELYADWDWGYGFQEEGWDDEEEGEEEA